MANFQHTDLIRVLREKNYTVFEADHNPYNLNIVGVRNGDSQANSFDDWLAVFWKYKGGWEMLKYEITTDPGHYYLENPMNVMGTAILKEGQYKASHKLGTHKGYKALEQCGNLTVWRDRDRDKTRDPLPSDTQTSNSMAINIHRAKINGRSKQVDQWSAGCQVFSDYHDFQQFMSLCTQASKYWGDKYTYTLINSGDL